MCDLYNDANKDAKIVAYNFQPLKSMDFHSYQGYKYKVFWNTYYRLDYAFSNCPFYFVVGLF